jgi:hypothetical protein
MAIIYPMIRRLEICKKHVKKSHLSCCGLSCCSCPSSETQVCYFFDQDLSDCRSTQELLQKQERDFFTLDSSELERRGDDINPLWRLDP